MVLPVQDILSVCISSLLSIGLQHAVRLISRDSYQYIAALIRFHAKAPSSYSDLCWLSLLRYVTTTTSSSGEAQSSTGQSHITEWWTITRDAVYNTHLGCGLYPKNVGLWSLERYIAAHLLYSSAFITYSNFYLIIENPIETTPQCCLSINVKWTIYWMNVLCVYNN